MGGSSFRRFTIMVFIAFLVWSSSLDSCIARRSRHWRSSLSKKKGKSHGSNGSNNHHSKGSKPKSPPHGVPSPSPALPPPKDVPVPSPPQTASEVFNVLDYGAKGDGKTDDTKAFRDAWAAACKVHASMMLVPEEHVFLVGPISFSGPYCQTNIVFQLDGTIVAPTDSGAWGRGLLQWLQFTKLVGISIQGKGTIEGSGSVWWQDEPFDDPVDDETKLVIPLNDTVEEHPPTPGRDGLIQKMPSIKPTALRFYGSFNVSVTGITIQKIIQSPGKIREVNTVFWEVGARNQHPFVFFFVEKKNIIFRF